MSKRLIFFVGLSLVVLTVVFTLNNFTNINSQNNTVLVTATDTSVNSEKNLHDTVKIICKSVEKNDIDILKNFVTEVPDVYTKKSRESMRKYAKMDEKTFKELTKEKKGKLNFSLYPISANKKDLVYNAIPAIKLIQEEKRKFIGIVDIKQFENEAKATVTFGNDEQPSFQYEILLFKGNDGWKTFRFTYPDRWADEYAEQP